MISSLSLGETDSPQISSPLESTGQRKRGAGKGRHLCQRALKLLPDGGQEELLPHVGGVVLAALETPGASLLHVRVLPERLPEGALISAFLEMVVPHLSSLMR